MRRQNNEQTGRPARQRKSKARRAFERALKEYETRIGTGEGLKVTDLIRLAEAGLGEAGDEAVSVRVRWDGSANR